MTIDEFNKTGWTGGMKCTYQGQDYDIGSANFEEKLVGLCMGHDEELVWVRCESVDLVAA